MVLVAAMSCQEAIITDKADGAISVNIDASPVVELVTKTDGETASTLSADNFNVYVRSEDVLYREYIYKDMPDQIKVPAGTYTVSADNLTESASLTSNSGWGEVRYFGQSEPKAVVAGETPTEYSFTCTMANTALSINFDSSISTYFEDFKVIAYTEDTRKLHYTSETTSAVGYFSPGTLKYTFTGTYMDDTTPMAIDGTKTLDAAKHLHLTFRISEQNGPVGKPVITVDSTCDDLNSTITVDPSENGSFKEETDNENN